MPSFILAALHPCRWGAVWVGHVAPEWFAIHFGRTTHGQQTDDTRQLRTWDGIVFYMQERHDMGASLMQNRFERWKADTMDTANLKGACCPHRNMTTLVGSNSVCAMQASDRSTQHLPTKQRPSITESGATIMVPSRISLEKCGRRSHRTRPGCGAPCSSTSC